MARKSASVTKPSQIRVSTTDDLPEGGTNLYYTQARAHSRVDTLVDSDYIQNMNNLDADLLNAQPTKYYRRIVTDASGTRIK